MRTRYLAAISWDSRSRSLVRDRMAKFPALPLVFERGPLLLFSSNGGHRIGPDGIVLGTLFSRSSDDFRLDPCVATKVLGSGGDYLADVAWGGYVAWVLLPGSSEVTILRAPFGQLPCYWHRSGELTLAASDISALVRGGAIRPFLDVAELARHMAAEDLRRSQTCLTGVLDLRGGDRLLIRADGVESKTFWSPWPFAARDREISDPQGAAAQIRNAVHHAVGCAVSPFRSVVLKLSGGLDSSIVAAALSLAKASFTCLNLVTEHPAGDERDYCRIVASHVGAPLVERYRQLADVDLQRSAAVRLPRPSMRAFTQASTARVREIARETGSDAVFDGGGGDNVFCSLQSARPAADCILSSSGRSSFWATARSIAELAEVDLWTVVHRSLSISLRRSASYRFEPDTRFMSTGAADQARSEATHPWLTPTPGILPGKAAHVALIAAAQSVVEDADAEDDLPGYSPLISQPVIETCLRVASWQWFGSGLNRFAARRAFARDLPPKTIERRSKGGPDCFVADLYEAHRNTIRELLLGGVLHQHKLIDSPSIEAALADQSPVQGHDFLRIMHLVDTEAWARAWS